MPARSGLLRLGLAFAVTLAIAVGVLIATDISRQNQQHAASRPQIQATAAYRIEYRDDASAQFVPIRISEQGAECAALEASRLLYQTCALAVNTDAALIAGEARGRLNTEYTPALEAIIWRGRLSAGLSFCAMAGLLDEQLLRCERNVSAPEYIVADSGLEVRLPAAQR